MFRAIPTNNKLCFDRQIKRSWRIHSQKLKKIKGSIGKDKPEQYIFLEKKPKKTFMKEIRKMQIQKQNDILLNKIKQISKGKKKSCDKLMNEKKERKKKTLNEPFRKRCLMKIDEQNQEILKRIRGQKSAYNSKKWQKQRQEIEKNITLISQFPYKQYPLTQTKVNFWTTQTRSFQRNSYKDVNQSRFKSLMETTMKINQNYYLVTSYHQNKQFIIELEDLQDDNKRYRLEIEEKEFSEILKNEYDNDFEKLIKSLEIDEEKGCFLRCEKQNKKKSATYSNKL